MNYKFKKKSFQELDHIVIRPHGQNQLSNKKESSKSVYPVEISELINIKNAVKLRTSELSFLKSGKRYKLKV